MKNCKHIIRRRKINNIKELSIKQKISIKYCQKQLLAEKLIQLKAKALRKDS